MRINMIIFSGFITDPSYENSFLYKAGPAKLADWVLKS